MLIRYAFILAVMMIVIAHRQKAPDTASVAKYGTGKVDQRATNVSYPEHPPFVAATVDDRQVPMPIIRNPPQACRNASASAVPIPPSLRPSPE